MTLDAIRSDAKSVGNRVGREYKEKLEEYFQSIRDIETRLSKEEQWIGVARPEAPFPEPRQGITGKEEVWRISREYGCHTPIATAAATNSNNIGTSSPLFLAATCSPAPLLRGAAETIVWPSSAGCA